MINTYKILPRYNWIRTGIYSIEEVLSKRNYLPKKQAKIYFDGDMINMNSHRYHNFAEHGIVCVDCGLEGLYFVKERNKISKTFHFNLYAIDENGQEILMTKDHIIPKSKGGPNSVQNYQTMCCKCNTLKGNAI